MSERPTQDGIPAHIVDAERTLSMWFAERNIAEWKLGNCMNRIEEANSSHSQEVMKCPSDISSIDEVCALIKWADIESTEYTDCAILYEVTFDQLRLMYDMGRQKESKRDAATIAQLMEEVANELEVYQCTNKALNHVTDELSASQEQVKMLREVLNKIESQAVILGTNECSRLAKDVIAATEPKGGTE